MRDDILIRMNRYDTLASVLRATAWLFDDRASKEPLLLKALNARIQEADVLVACEPNRPRVDQTLHEISLLNIGGAVSRSLIEQKRQSPQFARLLDEHVSRCRTEPCRWL